MTAEPAFRRQVIEWGLTAERAPAKPFLSPRVTADLAGPDNRSVCVHAFYDGENTWKVRFNPPVEGEWRIRIRSAPHDPGLSHEESFWVTDSDTAGFLVATPGHGWGFSNERGEPVLITGDTTYNLFGMAHCGIDVESFMRRRADQGFNLLRVRLPVSRFHPPAGESAWQTRSCWPWGGSEQHPQFDTLNLAYFRTVDRVVQVASDLGLYLEMIMEAWGFDYPFNCRDHFVAEWEELWLRYLIARYDAYSSAAIWTPMNEYEFYPQGDMKPSALADLWMMRTADFIRRNGPHHHVIGVHNGPRKPPFADRFETRPGLVDAVMFQEWGTHDEKLGWLAAGLDEVIDESLSGWQGSAVLAEYGYERNLAFPRLVSGHEYCDVSHTRRGAWRGAFRGLGLVTGFENSWGPFDGLAEDQEGLVDFLQIRHFFSAILPFDRLRPDDSFFVREDHPFGRKPLVLSGDDGQRGAVYFPVGGRIARDRLPDESNTWWFDPRSGSVRLAAAGGRGLVTSPGLDDRDENDDDWILYWMPDEVVDGEVASSERPVR